MGGSMRSINSANESGWLGRDATGGGVPHRQKKPRLSGASVYGVSCHGRCAPGCMKQGKLCCGRRRGRRRLGASEPVSEFDRRPFEHR